MFELMWAPCVTQKREKGGFSETQGHFLITRVISQGKRVQTKTGGIS